MKFSVGCSLAYRLDVPVPFVFNIEAARFCAQTVLGGTGSATAAGSAASFRQAAAGRGNDPPTGSQRRVQVRFVPPCGPSGQ